MGATHAPFPNIQNPVRHWPVWKKHTRALSGGHTCSRKLNLILTKLQIDEIWKYGISNLYVLNYGLRGYLPVRPRRFRLINQDCKLATRRRPVLAAILRVHTMRPGGIRGIVWHYWYPSRENWLSERPIFNNARTCRTSHFSISRGFHIVIARPPWTYKYPQSRSPPSESGKQNFDRIMRQNVR